MVMGGGEGGAYEDSYVALSGTSKAYAMKQPERHGKVTQRRG